MANKLIPSLKSELNKLYLTKTGIFSEELLEYEDGKQFKNPWHINIIYDILDNILTQEPAWTDKKGMVHVGKIIFNRMGKINRLVSMALPRNHAKSTVVSVNWPIKKLYENPNERFVIGSNVSSQASSFLRETVSHLERGTKLKETMGDLKPQIPETWTDHSIIINRTTKKKDPSISTVGTGGAVLSKRCDIGILDDLLNPDNTRTEEGRQKTKFWVDNVFKPTIEPKTGRFIIIGTLWYEGDYLDDCLKNETFDIQLILRCYVKDSKLGIGSNHELALDIRDIFSDEVIEAYDINADTGVLWPDRFPDKELQLIKANIGSTSFNRQYMNIIISDETSLIKSPWIEQCADRSRILIPRYNPSSSNLGSLVIATGVDLAISENSLADYTSITTTAKTRENKFVVLHHQRGHWSPAEIRNRIKGENDNFHPSVILVEDNGFQASLVKDMKLISTAPIRGFTTTGEKFDDFVGINSLAVYLENKQMILPANPSDVDTVEWFNLIRDQMLRFPSGHTGDDLMSLWFSITGLRNLSNNQPRAVKIKGGSMYRAVMVRG